MGLPIHFISLQDPDNPAEDFIADMEVKVGGACSCPHHFTYAFPFVVPQG